MSNVALKLSEFQKYNAENILDCEAVMEKVVEVYNLMHGEGGEAFFERERQNFQKIISESIHLKKCTAFSIYTSIIDLSVYNLSVEPGAQATAYLIPRNVNIGKGNDGKDVYETRCTLKISGYGELVIRASAGQILYADNPIVVYDNDEFSCSVSGEKKSVEYKCNLPHKGHQVIGCFIRIVRSDRSVDYSWLLEEEIERLKGYSSKANKKWNERERRYECKANDLYTSNDGSIDTGFLIAKTIKHAFKTYPKIKVGKSTVLQSEDPEPEKTEDIYGVHTDSVPSDNERPFGPPVNDMAKGVTIDNSSNPDSPF
jgi:recombinational DNA repair protein RecT